MASTSSTSDGVASRESLITAFKVLSGLLTLTVLIQAVIAGHFLYGDWSITPHGIIGNISFLFAVGLLVIAIVGRLPRTLVAVSGALVVLMTIQIGLGYSTNEDTRAAGAWHIPLGVVIFAGAVYLQALLHRLRT